MTSPIELVVRSSKASENHHSKDDNAILSWVSARDMQQKHLETFSIRAEGTGGWLLQHPEFVKWVSGHSQSPVLWCPGLPNTGKTVLSSIVVDYLSRHHQGPSTSLAYIYCDSEVPAEKTALALLSSICRQLASQKPELPLQLRKLYKQMTKEEERPGLDDIMLLITALCDSFETVFVCVDGLTECDVNGERPILISKLRWMRNHSARVFVTACIHNRIPEPCDCHDDIYDEFESPVEIKADEEDIRKSLLQRLADDVKTESLFSELKTTKDAIIEPIVVDCGGMFLMAQLKLDRELRRLRKEADQKDLKADSSTSLEVATEDQKRMAVWREGLRIIRQQHPFRRDLALKTLSWILHLKEPLLITEFAQALNIDIESAPPFLMNRVDIRVEGSIAKRGGVADIILDEDVATDFARHADPGATAWESATSLLEICEGLITFGAEGGKIVLSDNCTPDPSAEDLKELVPDPHLRIARTCLKFLCRPECIASNILDRVKNEQEWNASQWAVPFKWYAKRHWASHYDACDDEALDDLVVEYLCTIYENPARWVEERKPLWQPTSYVVVEDDETPLLKAARLGLNRVLAKLLSEREYDIHAESWKRESASSVAVAAGHTSTVQLLYKHGALLVDYRDDYGYTLLHAAARNDDEVMVALLIWSGMNPNTKSAGHDPVLPIQTAAQSNSARALDMLLEHGADLADGVMQSAAGGGDVETVKILMKRGFQLSAPTGSGDPPLHAAIKSGSRPLVEYMIATGADVFELGYRRTSAIHVAAGEGYLDIVELLLQHGADPFIMDDGSNSVCDGTTAFEDAMRDNHHEVVKSLLPLLHSGISNQTVLGMMQAAIGAKLTEIAKRLLDLVTGELVYKSKRGAKSLLSTAIAEDDEEMVNLLLDRRASVLFQDETGRSPLHVAANGHESATKILLEHGADPNLQDKEGNSPLHEAANGHPRITKMLLERGANPDLKTRFGVAPLHVAACSENVETLNTLLGWKLDLTIQAEDGSTALVAASYESKPDAVRLLLQYGAPVNVPNIDGETALHHAIIDNDADLVRDLLRNGIDTSIRSRRGGSALHLAAFRGQAAILGQLLEYGADVELGHQYDGDGYSPPESSDWNSGLTWNQARSEKTDHPNYWSHIDSQWRPLHSAVCGGHKSVVEILLRHGADISSRGSAGETPLHVAASAGEPEIVKFLLSNGANISEKDNNGQTALHAAALASAAAAADKADKHFKCACKLAKEAAEKPLDHSKAECVNALLDNGSDPMCENHEGLTPLALAVRAGHEDVVETLIGRKVSSLFSTAAYVKLLEACAAGGTAKSLEIVSNAFNETDESRLAWDVILNNAVVAGDHEMVSLAVRKGARPTLRTADGGNPFHRAIVEEKVKIVDSLLGAGADFLAVDDSGRNALHIACSHRGMKTLTVNYESNDKKMIASYLLEDGAPVNSRTPEGDTALHFAVTTGDIRLVRTLVDYKASVNVRNKRNATPLHAAVSAWVFPQIVALLLDKGACPTAQDLTGHTPLHLIRSRTKEGEAVADLLLKHGAADPSIRARNGDMAIHCAIRRSNWPVFKRMVEAGGASVNDQGAKGRTVLHIAAKHGHVGSIEPLIKLGANVDAVDREGWTPLHHAARGHHREVLAILLKHQRRAGAAAPIASALRNDSAHTKKLLMDAEINTYERGTLEGGGTSLHEQLTTRGRNGV